MIPCSIFSGKVQKGNQLGRTIGFPTANLKPAPGSSFPLPYGVYAVKVQYQSQLFNGMANVGVKPTLEAQEFSIEVNLFDFSHEIYGEEVTVFFYDFIREERKFAGLDALKSQITHDKTLITRLLSDRM